MNCKSLMFGGLLSLATIGAADAAVVTGDLNLRTGPGTGYRIIDTMPQGSYVNVLGCIGSWCRVDYAGMVGYASASYLGNRTTAYTTAPVYVAPRVYAAAPPAIGFGFGFGRPWYWRSWYY